MTTKAIEAGARAMLHHRSWSSFWSSDEARELAQACIEAAMASGELVPASAELSGLRDRVAEAIYGEGSDLCDVPWITLSDEMKLGWRGEADRALSAVKDYLTSDVASAVAAERERCAAHCDAYATKLRTEARDLPEGDRERSNLIAAAVEVRIVEMAIRALEPASGEYVLAPREPTELMLNAPELPYSPAEMREFWTAMLNAATSNGSGK